MAALLAHIGRAARATVHRHGERTTLACRDGDRVAVYDADTAAASGPPGATFPLPWPDRHVSSTAPGPGHDVLVVTGTHAVRAVEPGGRVRWELRHACWSRSHDGSHESVDAYPDDIGHRYPDGGSAYVTADGAHVWAHVPVPLAGDASGTEGGEAWLVLDAATGQVLARTVLDTCAKGSHHLAQPDGIVGLCVGEGQDGAPHLWGAYDGTALTVRHVGVDEVPADVNADGTAYLTVDHDQSVLRLRRTGDDALVAEFASEDVVPGGPDDEDGPLWDYHAGFADETTAIVSSHWHERHWLLDLASGEVRRIEYGGAAEGPPIGIGGGRWLATVHGETGVWTGA